LVENITAQKEAEQAVERERESLRQMLDLLERDRELVAFEIHDGFSQQLTGALLNLEAAQQAQGRSPEQAEKSFGVGLWLLRESIAESRRLVRGLRPPVLDEFGIVPAIEHLIDDHHTAGGGRVEFVAPESIDRVAQPIENALFRIVQETLNNARKYSRSDRICVELAQENNWMRVEVRDWGIGFDPEAIGAERFGLRGIRERARLLGGTAEIDAKPGKGTRISVKLPLVRRVATASGDY
jgi:signal transduction histidine kinase